jgi:RsiW-degrading membrane proteinase PrsW (M82 family)
MERVLLLIGFCLLSFFVQRVNIKKETVKKTISQVCIGVLSGTIILCIIFIYIFFSTTYFDVS